MKLTKNSWHTSWFVLFGAFVALACGEDSTASSSAGGMTGSGGGGGTSSKSGSGGSKAGGGSSNGGSSNAGGSNAGGSNAGSSNAGTGSGGTPTGDRAAGDLAERLRGDRHFLIGMGNDLNNDHNQDGAYTLGVTLDLHYAYLSGLMGENGWPDWNPGGYFVNILTDSADAHGVTPMFTLYAMAASGENNLGMLVDDADMGPYWEGAKLLFQRLGEFGKPGVVHLEPDFWAFAQQAGDPTQNPAHVGSLLSECADLPEDVTGVGRCLVRLARMYAPEAVVGFHASAWAGEPSDTVDFLLSVGAGEADFVAVDPLDRDAGCFEAHVDPACQRNDGPWYWDETNQQSPNFHEHLAIVATISSGVAPVMWWQVPFGVPSDTPGGSPGAYRDNRVHYLFNNVDEFVAAGMVGAAFGVGAGNQTYITTDGGQFQDAVTAYFANPTPLP